MGVLRQMYKGGYRYLGGYETPGFTVGNLRIAPEVNFRQESAQRIFGFFTRPKKRVGLVKSTIFSIVKKPKFLSALSNQIIYPDNI